MRQIKRKRRIPRQGALNSYPLNKKQQRKNLTTEVTE